MADHFNITQIGFSIEPKVIIKQNNENNCIDMIQHFNAIKIKFLTEPEVKKPKLSDDGSFYIIYLPEKKIKLRPRDSAMLNLRLNVNLPNEIEAMIGLLPSFVSKKVSIENSNWISNKRKDEIIQPDILNRHFCNTIKIRKNQELAYISLKIQKTCDKLVTTYNIYNIYIFFKTKFSPVHNCMQNHVFEMTVVTPTIEMFWLKQRIISLC